MRKVNINKPLYHVSRKPDLKELIPQIPFEAFAPEDCKTPRCCFSTSINGCLSAVVTCGDFGYVYTPKNLNELKVFKPSVKEVYDVKYTNEFWVLNTVSVECIGIIYIAQAGECRHSNYICDCFTVPFFYYSWTNKIFNENPNYNNLYTLSKQKKWW